MSQTLAPPRLLIVDDNRDNLALIRLFLESDHFSIDEAVNGARAVELFTANAYDLVLMDLEMPIVDGYEATRRIRALEQARGTTPVPILALTAHALDEHRLRCQEAGFTDFLVKPVRKAAMLGVLLGHLGRNEPLPVQPDAATRGDAPDPARLAALLPVFYDVSRQALEAVQTALRAGDLEAVRAQGHRLKGSAGSYGFSELAQAGAALERAGEQGDRVAAGTAWEWASALLAKARLDWPA
ncbi:response regulator [Desulfovibrio sp. TomC]|uniref:response regulator n=1 Tax=Desulfovibrio sp. TomC TaxID=1562888 RepID=UPI0005754E85|nr:response regulator [Desulfovibrio sp. TomC]KHK03149.1 PAS/PAC sensor hybrid histidine kinase [Desulfovibrio sp. TomC]